VCGHFVQVMMVNNYEQNIASVTKKLKNVTSLLEQKVHVVVPVSVFFVIKMFFISIVVQLTVMQE